MKSLFFNLWKFAKCLMSVLKAQLSFPSNFASIFSAIKYNSSLLFYLKTLYTLVKRHPLKWKLHRRVIKTLRKNWLVVSNIKLGIGKFSPDHIKLWKHHFDGLFLSKIYKVWAKKIQISYLSWDWALIKNIWINPDLMVSKITWEIRWILTRAVKCL